MRITTILSLLLFSVISNGAFSMDIVKVPPPESDQDRRYDYPNRLLKAALDATIATDGPYSFAYAPHRMSRKRALTELKTGELVNVFEAPTQNEWEQALIPIRIPLRKGLLSYRLFLIKQSNAEIFSKLKTANELKTLRAGLGAQWSTTVSMTAQDFNIVTGGDYEGLFQMLNWDRFDYFPRGINEIFPEYEARKTLYPEMIIEATKAMYLPTPSYFFVSPQQPKLADRIKRGLLVIIENGVFDREFNQEFSAFINAAKLNQRTIFKYENNSLSSETPLGNRKLWFSP